jgi:hypothetical protein
VKRTPGYSLVAPCRACLWLTQDSEIYHIADGIFHSAQMICRHISLAGERQQEGVSESDDCCGSLYCPCLRERRSRRVFPCFPRREAENPLMFRISGILRSFVTTRKRGYL